MDEKISKTFCAHPFTGIFIGVDGKFKFCCADSEIPPEALSPKFHISTTSILDLFNSPAYRLIRFKLLNHMIPKTCKNCFINQETEIVHGNRIDFAGCRDKNYLDFNLEMNISHVNNIEIWFENKCNLKCRSCDPHSSDQIASEWQGIVNSNKWTKENLSEKYLVDNWTQNPKSWNNLFSFINEIFKRNTEQTLQITMAGGEPFLSDGMYSLLNFCIDEKLSKKIVLHYKTNLTVLPSKLTDLWLKFHKVIIAASADGTEQTFEYMRYPAIWQKFVKNIEYLQNFPNVFLKIHPTIQAYNILSIAELYQWCVDHQIYFSVPLGLVMNPKILNIRVLPLDLKKIAATRLLKFYSDNYKHKYFNHKQHQYIWLVKYMLSEDWSHHFKDFADFTKHIDKTRNQNVLDIMPELKPYWSLP